MTAGGVESEAGGVLGRAPAGGMLEGAANGGLAFPTDGGLVKITNGDGLVMARGRTLSRHQRIPSLHLSPVVSGRSTGRW